MDIGQFIREYMEENSPPYILKLSDEFNVDDVYLYSWHPIPTSNIMQMRVRRESDELKNKEEFLWD